MSKNFADYIVSNQNRKVIYTGMTDDLLRELVKREGIRSIQDPSPTFRMTNGTYTIL